MFPDYQNNIINISATLSKFLGVPTQHATFNVLEEELSKNYKNVVFICFDGLGIHPLNINLEPTAFLQKHLKLKLTSVFPATTTNATTTLTSATTPSEHGMFAWCLYFKELDKVIDVYVNRDHYTHEAIDPQFIKERLPHDNYFDKSTSGYNINSVYPPYGEGSKFNNYRFQTIEEQFKHLSNICQKEGKQFIYSYAPYPDNIMHDYGVTSPQAKTIIEEINQRVEQFAKDHKDTLLIISADHGQIDIDDWILIYEDQEFLKYLEAPPFGEARAMFVKIKPNQDEEFLNYVKQEYGNQVEIFKSQDLIGQGVFGNSTKNSQLLGDYIIVLTNNKHFVFSPLDNLFKGHHTGLCKEMLVPLIIIGDK